MLRGILLGFMLAPLLAAAQHSPYTQIAFTWDYTPNLPICSNPLVSCFSGFRMSDELSGHVVANLPPLARSWTFVVPGGVWYGKHVFDLIATGFDVNGVADQSAPAKVVVDVEPPPTVPATFMGVLN